MSPGSQLTSAKITVGIESAADFADSAAFLVYRLLAEP